MVGEAVAGGGEFVTLTPKPPLHHPSNPFTTSVSTSNADMNPQQARPGDDNCGDCGRMIKSLIKNNNKLIN